MFFVCLFLFRLVLLCRIFVTFATTFLLLCSEHFVLYSNNQTKRFDTNSDNILIKPYYQCEQKREVKSFIGIVGLMSVIIKDGHLNALLSC